MIWQKEGRLEQDCGNRITVDLKAMDACEKYYAAVQEQLNRIYTTQMPAIGQAATIVADALASGHWLYVFGTGHSHMLAEEVFYRAGGLARVAPILDDKLMLHQSASQSTLIERDQDYAGELMSRYELGPGDAIIIASNSGRNGVAIELAIRAAARNVKTVAITNLKYVGAWPSRHSSGKNLAEVVGVAIDNCGGLGDACVDLPGLPAPIGPTSTILGALIINLIVARAIEQSLAQGCAPEVFISSNTGGDAHNKQLLAKYKNRIRHL